MRQSGYHLTQYIESMYSDMAHCIHQVYVMAVIIFLANNLQEIINHDQAVIYFNFSSFLFSIQALSTVVPSTKFDCK